MTNIQKLLRAKDDQYRDCLSCLSDVAADRRELLELVIHSLSALHGSRFSQDVYAHKAAAIIERLGSVSVRSVTGKGTNSSAVIEAELDYPFPSGRGNGCRGALC